MDLAHLDMSVAHDGIEAPGAPWEDNPCCYREHSNQNPGYEGTKE